MYSCASTVLPRRENIVVTLVPSACTVSMTWPWSVVPPAVPPSGPTLTVIWSVWVDVADCEVVGSEEPGAPGAGSRPEPMNRS